MTDLAAQAVAAAMEVEAKKDRLVQNQDGTWKLTLTIAPDGLPDPIMKAVPGVRYCVVFVEKGDNEEPVQHAPAASETPRKRHWDELSYAEQAGMRCADEKFQEFLYNTNRAIGAILDHDDNATLIAASAVREFCQVDSRADLNQEDPSFVRDQWRALNAEFEEWDNRVAERR